MTTEDAKSYLSKREIPQLFESLMTGLMYYRPEDHIDYLQHCLEKIKKTGLDTVRWNIFIESRKKTPLPPISPVNDNGYVTPAADVMPSTVKTTSPLPPIGQRSSDRFFVPNCPLVLIAGGPGCGKGTQCKKLVERFEGWTHISLEDAMRAETLHSDDQDNIESYINKLLQPGEITKEGVSLSFVEKQLERHATASGLILEGFPMTQEQLKEYHDNVGRIDLSLCLDCDEQHCQQRLARRASELGRLDDSPDNVAARIAFFKEKTLPTIKHIDDMDRLVVIDAEREVNDIFENISTLFESVFYSGGKGPIIPSVNVQKDSGPARSLSAQSDRLSSPPLEAPDTVPPAAEPSVQDTGRKPDMPQCPVLIVAGGPGAGKTTVCKRLAEKHSNVVHISLEDRYRSHIMNSAGDGDKKKLFKQLIEDGQATPDLVTAEVFKKQLQPHATAAAIILDGFPLTARDLEQLNSHVGGVSAVALLECTEQTSRARLAGRWRELHRLDDNRRAVRARLQHYGQHTLPVLAHYDDLHKLHVIDGERDVTDVFEAVNAVLESLLSGNPAAAVPVKEPSLPPAEPITVTKEDEGRVASLPQNTRIISVIAASCVLATRVAEAAAKNLQNVTLYPASTESVSADALVTYLQSQSPDNVILPCFPTSLSQVEGFNSKVGALSDVIVLDYTEDFLRLEELPDTDIPRFKQNALPVLADYDDRGKLHVIHTDNTAESTIVAGLAEAIRKITQKDEDSAMADELKNAKVFVMLGGPGSGKGTQCAKLVEKYGYTHLSTGDLLRAEVASGSERGKTLTAIMEKGDLVPLDIVLTMLKEAMIKHLATSKGFLIDGYPRELDQALRFEKEVAHVTAVLYFELSDEVMTERLLERGKTSGRADDNAETIKKRLVTFHNLTQPVVDHYSKLNKATTISAVGSVDEIFAVVCPIIEKL